ncbi:hypothetical protein LUZ60_007510 [Juncus effusus]|nr:hypothetical protein LUZ60_007510 [Juncus effusus]
MASNSLTSLLSLLLILSTLPSISCQLGNWRLLFDSIGLVAMHMQLLPNDRLLTFDRTDFGPSNLSFPNCPSNPLNPNPNSQNPNLYQSTTYFSNPPNPNFYPPSTDSSSSIPPNPNPNNLYPPTTESSIPQNPNPNFYTDCTAHSLLLDLTTLSLTPLSLLSDPWCSSASLLPNGSLLQTGGFGTGDRSVRLFSLSSLSWTENPNSVLVRRWYASDQLLPDGTVIIIGGRRQFNFEYFPPYQQNYQLFDFLFLEETNDPDSENNLYPFVHLLPDGNLFIFANTKAIIFDPLRQNPTRYLPEIPNSVPRNYPSSGSSVLLPLNPNEPSRAEILICGGAPRGAFLLALHNSTFLQADKTCGRIVPTDPRPVWVMEEMPLPRVMGDMVILPTGDILIINGASSGTAGWELGQDPVLNPVLYRPYRPVGYRFETLNPSSIPRMYHSSALLDSFGRVLVGGSNPHIGYLFQNVTYKTELSLEAFLPPYLEPALDFLRPRNVEVGVGSTGQVQYGEILPVKFELDEDLGFDVEMCIISPGFFTHSVGMNQRMVRLSVLRVERVGPVEYVAEAVGPGSAEVAPPGYYMWFVLHGGVPGKAAWVRVLPSGAFS